MSAYWALRHMTWLLVFVVAVCAAGPPSSHGDDELRNRIDSMLQVQPSAALSTALPVVVACQVEPPPSPSALCSSSRPAITKSL